MRFVTKSLFIQTFFCFIAFTNASKAEISAIELDTLNGELYEQAKTNNNLEFKEITSNGDIQACSLSFNYVYRDFVYYSGSVVQLAGSWNHHYLKGKNNSYSLKLVAKLVDLRNNTIDFVNPKFLDLLISNKSISKYKILQNVGDNKSLWQAYSDNEFDILKNIAENSLNDTKLKFSFLENGVDVDLDFSKITTKNISDKEISKFYECSHKIVKKIGTDLEN